MNRLIRPRRRRMRVLGAVLLVSLLGIGCEESDAEIANGDDPLRALTVPHRSSRYGSTFWTQKSVADSPLWAKAVASCEGKDEGDHPNCDAVRHVQMIERMSRPPEDRPNEFRLMVPQAAEADDEPR